MQFDDEDDDMFIEGLYENGVWDWDCKTDKLVFRSNEMSVSEESEFVAASIVGVIDFKNDLDIIEQQRFRKRFQRRPTGEDDVVTLQDVKDLVLYITPLSLLTPSLINLLHQSTTERFLKAMIVYCQYYVQIAQEMERRVLELQIKISTQISFDIETQYRENLQDLRILVAKEYSTLVLGGSDLQKYHHMGPLKKNCSLSRREAYLFESLLRITIQIVWIALGRQSYSLIAKEIHRLFKTKYFNVAEHQSKTDSEAEMSAQEKYVLLGHCLHVHDNKILAHSPLVSEVICTREFDYRLFALGVIKYPRLSSRLHFFERLLVADETKFAELHIVLGIIGFKRSHFDTMLRGIEVPNHGNASSSSGSRFSVCRKSRTQASRMSKISTGSRRSKISGPKKLFPDLYIPEEYHIPNIPPNFPSMDRSRKTCNDTQRLKWLRRIKTKAKKRHPRSKS